MSSSTQGSLRLPRALRRGQAAKDVVAAPLQSAAAAADAGLRYVADAERGIGRVRHGKRFSYVAPDGKALKDNQQIARIRALAIPPAWRGVWICPHAHGHLQASGRDSKGRKQYRYHTRWREIRDEAKYARMAAFGQALATIRERTERDLSRPRLPREKVLATVVKLLEATLIRVGNEEYARQNRSYGLTTMRDSHVDIKGTHVEFRFRGKSGKDHVIGIQDPRLSRIVKRCQEIPGRELFQYLDQDGKRRSIESADVNAYLREISGEDFTAKDFRTWAATVLAVHALSAMEGVSNERRAKRNVVRAMEAVASRLGNTPAICRKSYVHPAVVESYLAGSLGDVLRTCKARKRGLRAEEARVLGFLAKAA